MNKFSRCWCYYNSGVKTLKILNSYKNEPIKVNTQINIVPQKLYVIKKKIQKKKKYFGKLFATALVTKRYDGSCLKYNNAKCIIFDKEKYKFLGSRIYCSAQKEVKKNNPSIRRVFGLVSAML